MMNSREKGKKLEKFVATLLEDIDSKCRPTKASGASNEISDILSKYFFIECKKRNTANITVNSKTWQKLCSDIPMGSQKIPLYILQNKENETFVVLGINDFINILKEKNEKLQI